MASWPSVTFELDVDDKTLSVASGATVFLHACNNDCTTAAIVLRSDSPAFLNATIVCKDAASQLEITLPAADDARLGSATVQFQVDAYAPAHAIAELQQRGKGDIVVVDASVLVNTPKHNLKLVSYSRGSIFVSAPSMILYKLDVTCHSKGNVQLDVANLVVDNSVRVYVGGNGSAIVAAGILQTPLLSLTADMFFSDFGSVDVSATSMPTPIGRVQAAISSNGAITLRANGNCGQQTIDIAYRASRSFSSGMRCESTEVASTGAGDIYVQSPKNLTIVGTSSVYVLGTAPTVVRGAYTLATAEPTRPSLARLVPLYEPSAMHFALPTSAAPTDVPSSSSAPSFRAAATWSTVSLVIACVILALRYWHVYRLKKQIEALAYEASETVAVSPLEAKQQPPPVQAAA